MNTLNLEHLITEREQLRAKIAEYEDQLESINAELLKHTNTGKQTIGRFEVQKVEIHKPDYTKIAADYPASEYPDLYQLKINSQQVKKHFAPAALEKYATVNTYLRVTLK